MRKQILLLGLHLDFALSHSALFITIMRTGRTPAKKMAPASAHAPVKPSWSVGNDLPHAASYFRRGGKPFSSFCMALSMFL